MISVWQVESRHPGTVAREQIRQDQVFAHGVVEQLPQRWQARMLLKWTADRSRHDETVPLVKRDAKAQAWANTELRLWVDRLESIRLPLDASDDDICKVADQKAQEAASLSALLHCPVTLRIAMENYVRNIGIEPPLNDPKKTAHVRDIPAIARMTDAQWWRRKLRALHAKVVEGAAMSMGYVNRTSDCYVSNESLARRMQQNRRNAKMLENTVAINEQGDEYTLAELSALGIANKAIRRAELMTRIAGFEKIARDCNDVGLFLTLTCPSRMHKWKTLEKGKVIQNSKYDGTLPNEAQAYLSKQVWARTRAKWKRDGIAGYGFRIVEPNHDGTPHWHLLLFFKREKAEAAVKVLRDYALKDSGDEIGAKEHRLKVVEIDWSRGSAAGYIAKYVAKNIDGYMVDKDLLGNDAIESSARVEAWASTWRIRQFQQIGGPPVGVWRELRRVKVLPDEPPECMVRAWNAVNRIEEGDKVKRADWAEYVIAQGGVAVGRNSNVRMEKKEVEGIGRYYEPNKPVPIGVSADHWELLPVLGDEILSDEQVTEMMEAEEVAPVEFKRFSRTVIAKSVRHVWEIIAAKMRGMVDIVLRVQAVANARMARFMELAGLRNAAKAAGDWVAEAMLQVQVDKVLAET